MQVQVSKVALQSFISYKIITIGDDRIAMSVNCKHCIATRVVILLAPKFYI